MKAIPMLLFLILYNFGNCQVGALENAELRQSGIVIANVDSLHRVSGFKELNKYELWWDSLSVSNTERRIENLKQSHLFQNSLSDQEQIDTIQKIKQYAIRYSENRSRFSLIKYLNQKRSDSTMIAQQSKATCLFEDSTISILTGVGIFGGVYFEMSIEKDKSNVVFIIDEHNEKIFKANMGDATMTSSIEVPMKRQELFLNETPQFKNGELLQGILQYETDTFFISSSFDPYLSMDFYDPNEVVEIYFMGELEFSCKVLQPELMIQW